MNNKKQVIVSFISANQSNFKRFELLEHFAEVSEEPSDVLFLVDVLQNDTSSVIRHEAAAQMLKIKQRKSHLITPNQGVVINALLHVVRHDTSMVARHEAAEALSYIGDEQILAELNNIIELMESSNELLETLQLTTDTIKYRAEKKIDSSCLGDEILKEFLGT